MTYLLLVVVVAAAVDTPLPFICCCVGDGAVDAEFGDDDAD